MPKDVREVVITIKSEAGGESSEAVTTEDVSSSTNTDSKTNNLSKAAFAQMIINTVNHFANEMVGLADYELDKSFALRDDYIGQRNMQVAQFMINQTSNFVSNTANTAVMGFAVGGVAGAVIGAVLGAFNSVLSVRTAAYKASDQQNIAIKQMDLQLGYTRSRAGWSINAASIGEDL